MDREIKHRQHSEAGFTLIEVMVASVVMVIGLLSLAYGIGVGLTVVNNAQQDSIARQKAHEALDSVFTARDTANISFSQICNVGSGASCIFVNGYTPLYIPGNYGLVNTGGNTTIDSYFAPGPDGALGTADDIQVPLDGYQRQITITTISSTLIQITVTIQYHSENGGYRDLVSVSSLMSPYV